ncbi:MAG: hypothetical protein D8M59_10040 [Planctomycetes bacterium]|nr:hypothetical protein [Planctomycetota bacterium]NOG53401.1 hypothetical protein [Planctomycetota bacterium]
MRYTEFRDIVRAALGRNRNGLTWIELRDRCDLPYDRPCPSWVAQLEVEIGLERVKGEGRALVWKVKPSKG